MGRVLAAGVVSAPRTSHNPAGSAKIGKSVYTCACSMRHNNLQDLLHVADAQVEGFPPVRLRGVLLPAGARGLRAHIILAPAAPGKALRHSPKVYALECVACLHHS